MGGQSLEIRTLKFFDKVKEMHGNKYDLSKCIYKNNHSKVIIICSKHGIIEITAGVLMKGGECIKCSYEKRAQKASKFDSPQEMIDEMNKIHNNKFNYKNVGISVNKKITVICPKHGEYKIQAYEHLKGGDCKQCFLESDKPLMKSTQTFIDEAISVHGYKYNYSNTIYNGITNKIIIECPEHGEFKQVADTHLNQGSGCPKCKSSKGENKIINFLSRHNITFEFQKSFDKLKYKKKLRVDFFIPNMNVVLEFDGKQHFEKVNFTGKYTEEELENNLLEVQKMDSIKNEFCENNNIKLIRIPYWEIENIDDILKSSLL